MTLFTDPTDPTLLLAVAAFATGATLLLANL